MSINPELMLRSGRLYRMDNLPEFDDRLLEAVTWIRQHQPQ